MTMKINPGCEIPEVKVPPALGDFFTNLATQVVANAALGDAAGVAARAQQAVQDQLDDVTTTKDRIDRYTALATKFTEISCPLPKIPDPESLAS
jgi:hypothetical protein